VHEVDVDKVVHHAYVDKHEVASVEDGACKVHGVPAKNDIPRGDDHLEVAVVDIVDVVDERDVDVDL
jgi:hypothetical protein